MNDYCFCHLALILHIHCRHEYRPWTGTKRSRPTKTKQGFIIPEDHFVQESSYKADFKVNVQSFLNAGACSCADCSQKKSSIQQVMLHNPKEDERCSRFSQRDSMYLSILSPIHRCRPMSIPRAALRCSFSSC